MLMKRYQGNPCTLLESAADDDENKANLSLREQIQFQSTAPTKGAGKRKESLAEVASLTG